MPTKSPSAPASVVTLSPRFVVLFVVFFMGVIIA
jgi:hypothetical protein